MIKNFVYSLLFLLTFFLVPFFSGNIEAASFSFDKSTYSVKIGETVQVQVTINAGANELNGADAYIKYDPLVLSADSVTDGSFFPTVSKETGTPGTVWIAGYVDDPATSKTGTGTLATINFKGVKDGAVDLTFDCNLSKIVKNDINATNILECAKNGKATVAVGSGGSSAGSSTTESTDNPTELPKSGVFDNVTKLAIPGAVLFLLGVVAKLILI